MRSHDNLSSLNEAKFYLESSKHVCMIFLHFFFGKLLVEWEGGIQASLGILKSHSQRSLATHLWGGEPSNMTLHGLKISNRCQTIPISVMVAKPIIIFSNSRSFMMRLCSCMNRLRQFFKAWYFLNNGFCWFRISLSTCRAQNTIPRICVRRSLSFVLVPPSTSRFSDRCRTPAGSSARVGIDNGDDDGGRGFSCSPGPPGAGAAADPPRHQRRKDLE